jgi:hypothetical protein
MLGEPIVRYMQFDSSSEKIKWIPGSIGLENFFVFILIIILQICSALKC